MRAYQSSPCQWVIFHYLAFFSHTGCMEPLSFFSCSAVCIVLSDGQRLLSVCLIEGAGLQGEREGWIGCVECHSVVQKENVKHDRASSSGRTGWTGSDEIPCTDLLLLPVLSMLPFREEEVFTP